MAPKKTSIKKQVRKAVRDVKAYAKRKGLKTKSMGGGGGGSGIFSQFEGAKYANKRQWVNTPWPADGYRPRPRKGTCPRSSGGPDRR